MAHAPHAPAPAVKMGLPIPNPKLGMWLFLGTEIMFFTAFIGTYIVLRISAGNRWPTDPELTHIRIWAGGFNTFVLILSSYFVVVAFEAMQHKDFEKARRFMWLVMALGCLFLGIKAYEYYGKFAHDILPGHIPGNESQAISKVLRETEAAVTARYSALLPESETLSEQRNVLQKKIGDGEADADMQALAALDAEVRPFAEHIRANVSLDSPLVSRLEGRTAKGVPVQGVWVGAPDKVTVTLEKNDGQRVDVPARGLKVVKEPPPVTFAQVRDKLHEMQDNEQYGPLLSSVHHPTIIVHGNLFASVYFLMTGFHALHVIVGMILWLVVLRQGTNLSGWSNWVENSGLYWHFVDLVWIFLFPLIYII